MYGVGVLHLAMSAETTVSNGSLTLWKHSSIEVERLDIMYDATPERSTVLPVQPGWQRSAEHFPNSQKPVLSLGGYPPFWDPCYVG